MPVILSRSPLRCRTRVASLAPNGAFAGNVTPPGYTYCGGREWPVFSGVLTMWMKAIRRAFRAVGRRKARKTVRSGPGACRAGWAGLRAFSGGGCAGGERAASGDVRRRPRITFRAADRHALLRETRAVSGFSEERITTASRTSCRKQLSDNALWSNPTERTAPSPNFAKSAPKIFSDFFGGFVGGSRRTTRPVGLRSGAGHDRLRFRLLDQLLIFFISAGDRSTGDNPATGVCPCKNGRNP